MKAVLHFDLLVKVFYVYPELLVGIDQVVNCTTCLLYTSDAADE